MLLCLLSSGSEVSHLMVLQSTLSSAVVRSRYTHSWNADLRFLLRSTSLCFWFLCTQPGVQTMIVSQYRTAGCKHNASRLCFCKVALFQWLAKVTHHGSCISFVTSHIIFQPEVISRSSKYSPTTDPRLQFEQCSCKHIYLHNRHQWSWLIHSCSILSYSDYSMFQFIFFTVDVSQL